MRESLREAAAMHRRLLAAEATIAAWRARSRYDGGMQTVAFSLDTSAFDQALRDLPAELSHPLLQVVYALIGTPEILPRLFRFHLDRGAAAGALDQQRIRLQPTDEYLKLVLALRAVQGVPSR